MCLFFDQLTSYLPNQVSRWQFTVLESMVTLIAWHSAQTYPTLTALRARAIRTNNAIWPIISTVEPVALREQQLSYGHYDNVHPCHPHPRWAKGQNDHLFHLFHLLREHSRLARRHQLQRCTGRSAIIRRPIAISKRQIFRIRIGE